MLIATAALLGGCVAPGPRASAQQPTPVGEVGAAERMVAFIEHARLDRNWAEINRHLSTAGYTPEQRSTSPTFAFADVTSKLGEFKGFEFLLSVGSGGLEQPNDARPKWATVTVREWYNSARIEMEFHMRKEDGQWRLGGLRGFRH